MTTLFYEDLPIGHVQETPGRTVTEADVALFAGLSGDFHPLHTDAEYAGRSDYGGRIVHGPLAVAVGIGMIGRPGLLDQSALALLGLDWRFQAPVFPGDTLRVRATVVEKWLTRHPDRGVIVRELQVLNQRGEVVQTGQLTLLVRCTGARVGEQVAVTPDRLAQGMASGLAPGARGEVRCTVMPDMTAEGMGHGPPVLATPHMIALMERAAAAAIRPYLPPGYVTVGVVVDVVHQRAALVGQEVVAQAELIGVQGRRFTYKVEVTAGNEQIGHGRHQNHMVLRDRFAADAKA